MKKKLQEVKDDVTESTIEMDVVEETKEKKSLKRFIKPALIFGGGLLLGGLLLGRSSDEDECEDDDDSEEDTYDYYDAEEEAQREIALKIENGDMKIEDLEDTVTN